MTILKYLENTYIFTGNAILIRKGIDTFGEYLILDQTIFYPQWGGQPSDIGYIAQGENIFQVEKVRFDPSGEVYHYGRFIWGIINIWEKVDISIDSRQRIINAQNHSAGHLIDIAIKNIWLWNLNPIKWYHFPDGCYVEYIGEINANEEEVIQKLSREMKRLIQENIKIIISSNGDKSPLWKIPRMITYEGYEWCGCGGTHIRSSWEIGEIEIKKVKKKGGNIRISYEVTCI